MGRAAGESGPTSSQRHPASSGPERAAVTATAQLAERSVAEQGLTLVEQIDPINRLAQSVVGVVALAGTPVDSSAIAPAALILRDEGFVDLPGVTFGCNYDLGVLSFELSRGYTRAIDAGWLKLRARKVSANPNAKPRTMTGAASARAAELFALEGRELMRLARHHLLRDDADAGS